MNFQITKKTNYWVGFVLILNILNIFQVKINCNWILDLSEDEKNFYKPSLNFPTLTALVGDSVNLFCNITSFLNEDIIYLILWFKDNIRNPIYSIDARLNSLNQADHLLAKNLINRAFFNASYSIPYLNISPVKEEDNGEYKCRVDFRRGRTLYQIIKLNVIVPISKIKIFDQNGQVKKSIAGPYNEGSSLNLTCKTEGGNPAPSVFWYRGKDLIDESYFINSKTSINYLYIPALTRDNLMMKLTCIASNSNITLSVSSDVTIDLNLRVKEVKIVSSPKKLSIGQSSEFICQSIGSKPAPLFKWLIGDNQLLSLKETTVDDELIATSFLHLIPSASYHKKKLTCMAINTKFNEDNPKDYLILDILYPPLVYLAIGANLKNEMITVGSDVSFECNIQSNPPANKVGWTFNDKELTKNLSPNLKINNNNNSLLIRNTQRDHKGTYKCWASNFEGKGESDPIDLNIQHSPFCKPNQRAYFFVNKNEQVLINCEVEAEPSDMLTFHWFFNNSFKQKVDITNFSTKKTISVISYVPKSLSDYGSIFCWASNIIGDQIEPCKFFIIAAGPPDAPQNCTITNITTNELMIECEQRISDKEETSYHLEMYSNQTKIDYQQSEKPFFLIRSIPFQNDIFFKIYSSNRKGQSTVSILKLSNKEQTEFHTNIDSADSSSWLFLLIILVIIGVVFVLIMIAAKIWSNKKNKKNITMNHIIQESSLYMNDLNEHENYSNFKICQNNAIFKDELCHKNKTEMLIAAEPFVTFMPYSFDEMVQKLDEPNISSFGRSISREIFNASSNFCKSDLEKDL